MPIGDPTLTAEQAKALADAPPRLYGTWSFTGPLALTTTLTKVTGWVVNSDLAPVGVSLVNDSIVLSKSAVIEYILERSYRNGDINPADEVVATIEIQKNGVTVFTNSAPISPATNPGGDGVLPITGSFEDAGEAGDYYDMWVSGIDGVANPSDANLSRARLSVKAIFSSP